MNNVYVFDVDGTLTEPRQPITAGFARFFESFCENHTVYLVSGSDRPKLDEQLPPAIIKKAKGVFTCSAAELWVGGRAIYKMEHEFPQILIESLETFIDLSIYPRRFGNHIEYRTGMLNVSVVGRNAQTSDRKSYYEWDKKSGERRNFINRFLNDFSDYEASAGGEISVDIVPKGWNKSRALRVIKKEVPGAVISFFGDKLGPGGNDLPLGEALRADSSLHRIVPVNGYRQTWRHLRAVLLSVDSRYRLAS